MSRTAKRSLWLAAMILATLRSPTTLLSQVPAAQGQPATVAPSSTLPPSSLPNDWSNRHVVFSRPETAEQAARLEEDPRYLQQRYWQQQYWQQPYRQQRSLRDSHIPLPSRGDSPPPVPGSIEGLAKRGQSGDWQQNLGSGASMGSTNYPAKFTFSLNNANCGSAAQPDFVIYSTGLVGSATQASLVAYDNLYSGCTGTVPSNYWAYNTGGQILTSPGYSLDGSQVAFTQSAAGVGYLILLKWAPSPTESASNPMTINPNSTYVYYNFCPAPCLTNIELTNSTGNATDDTTSSVFFDYAHDTAYVGDGSGWLHKFTPLFKGVPTEIRTGGWPVQVNSTEPTALTDAVYDSLSGSVFVGDLGGYLYRVSATGSVIKSGRLDYGTGIAQGPVVDSVVGLVYVFSSSDNSGNCDSVNCTALYVFSNEFPAGSTGTEVEVGASTAAGTTPNPLYLGAFDSAYQNSTKGTGNIYVCGNTGGPPIMYQVAVTNGVLGTVTPGPVLSNATTPCSPVTGVPNPNASSGPTDWMFASAQTKGVASACGTGGCAFNFVATPWQASTAYAIGQEVVDTHFQVQVADRTGTSGTRTPTWQTTLGLSTTDGTVHWLDQGVVSEFTPASWKSGTAYAKNIEIKDSNGNIELVTTAGTSGTTTPSWSTVVGDVTADKTVRWKNVGAIAISALATAGGTSGFIYDNTVETLVGASQVYFSTLSNQTCGTSGTGGCAVQASQPALK